MYQPKLEKDRRCPLDYALELFSGKWKSRIICLLAKNSSMRYSSLRKELLNITDAVLSSTLKEMIASDIINRRSYDEIPPRVEYHLTPKGESLIPILVQLCEWSVAVQLENQDVARSYCSDCQYCSEK